MKWAKKQKVKVDFIKSQYRSGIKSYADFTKEVGLWDSEKHLFQKYLQTEDKILDLGCGTGRTTFPLYQLGYIHIIGVDLTPEMIEKAQELNPYFETNIDFEVGDALKLRFADMAFDRVIFSFNGLMSIPNQANRTKALSEINRVLKNKGIFIFTTHDREQEPQFFDFWKAEKERWVEGHQNPKLYEYGDLITQSKNESRDIFIHIPDQKEVRDLLLQNGFELIETFYRSDKFEESEQVKAKSGECRFWVARKKSDKKKFKKS